MSGFLKYEGYLGSVDVSVEDNCLHGKVQFIEDTITYEGQTPTELEQAFKACVDGYVATCKELGRKPQKGFSGSFNVRVGEELHKKAAVNARVVGVSLNEFVKDAINKRVLNDNDVTVHHLHEVKHVVRLEGTYVESAESGENVWQQKNPALIAQH